jgi:hypothetical protein
LNPSNTKRKTCCQFIDFARFPASCLYISYQATADYINAQDPSRNIKVGDYSEDDDFSGISYSSIDPQGNPTVSNSTSNRPFNTSNTNPIRNLTEQDDNTNQFRFQEMLV